MARITITVCDICEGKDKPTKKWTIITPDGSRRTVDLCDNDAAPITKVLGGPEAVEAPAKRGRKPGIQVTPVEELAKA